MRKLEKVIEQLETMFISKEGKSYMLRFNNTRKIVSIQQTQRNMKSFIENVVFKDGISDGHHIFYK